MVYGQLSYEQIMSRVRAKGKKGTLQASDGDGCLMKTLANITSDGVLSAPYFVGNGSGLTGLPTTLQQVVNKGNTVTSNTVQILSLVTTGSVTGISNILPVHTLDVGSNLYVAVTGSNVLTVVGNVNANYFYGNAAYLTGLPSSYATSTLQQVVDQGNTVTGNTVQFSGLVTSVGSLTGIGTLTPAHTLDVGSNLYVDETGSNVLTVVGNVAASYFVGDGSRLSGIQTSAPTLQSVVTQGNTSDKVIAISNTTSLTTTGFVGVSNTAPIHTLDVGSNLYVAVTGSNVLTVLGNVAASYFYGNAAYLTGLPSSSTTPSLQSVINVGNTFTGNTLIASNILVGNLLTNGLYAGIANTNPIHTLDVGSNLYIAVTGSNVLFTSGNIAASYFYGNAAYLSGLPTGVSVTPVPSNIDRYYPVLSSVTNGTPSLHTSDPNVYYQGSNLYISGTIKVLNTSKSLIESNIGTGMNQRYGIGADTNLQKLTLFTPDTEGTISFADAKSDGTFIELANVTPLTFNTSNLTVLSTNGEFSTLRANTINVNQSSTSYKTIKVLTSNGTSLRNLNFTNTVEGAQTIINIYPLRTSDLDIFASLSNTVGHVGTRTKVNFLSNIIINSTSHAILACYTSDSNTFVSVSEYF